MSEITQVVGPLTEIETAAVLAKHERMCWWVAKRVGAGLTEEDLEDLAGVVRTQFVRAAQTWDRSRGFQFATYALRAAVQQAKYAARRIRARGVKVPIAYDVGAPKVCDLNAASSDGADLMELLIATPDEEPSDIPADFWERAGSALTAKQRQCLLMRYRDGLTLREIGAQVGVSKERVRQLILAAMEKLRGVSEFQQLAGAI